MPICRRATLSRLPSVASEPVTLVNRPAAKMVAPSEANFRSLTLGGPVPELPLVFGVHGGSSSSVARSNAARFARPLPSYGFGLDHPGVPCHTSL